jgi:hypothetical protein
MRPSHVQTETGVEGLCKDGMSRIEDQLREQYLVGTFIHLGIISAGRVDREEGIYQKSTHVCDAVEAGCIGVVDASIMNELTSITWWSSQ